MHVTLGGIVRGARATWLVTAGIVIAVVVLAADRALRSPGSVVAAVISVGFVLLGVRMHRPRSMTWLLIALMLAFWALNAALVYVKGDVSTAAAICVWAGQALAIGITGHTMFAGARPAVRSITAGIDVLIIATVLALVGVQIVTARPTGSAGLNTAVISSVDVVLLGMLTRFAVSRRGLGPSSVLVLAGAFTGIVYELSSAVQGRWLALPGDPNQILGAVCLLLFGAAALHPSMTVAFSSDTFAQRRRPSTSLLGLLPLVLVPFGVWWVADAGGAPSLPPWAVPTTGAVIAGLCLARASAALRSSEYLAEHDPLTNLANRRGLARAFDEAPSVGALSLLLVDVDEFKQVNDTHGHDVGDALLLRLRDRLLIATGTSGLAARLGGDEFVVLLQTDQAQAVAGHFRRLLQAEFIVGGLVLSIDASVGIANAQPSTTLAELLTHADVAMYAAKAAGGDHIQTFHPAMRAEVARRFILGSQIRQLLSDDDLDVGQLEIHYQPLVELDTGRVIGAEALVRWRHPELGLLPPDSFLGLVTNHCLDAELDTAVLNDVVTQLADWREQGRNTLPVSVNLTSHSLDDPQLGERILRTLAKAQVPPSQLHVEITEHHLLSQDSPAEHTLEMLKALGVGVSLDDYGTGYTSLEYLRRFPVQVLKLDRSVVSSLDDRQIQLIAGVNAMAAALGLDVLAEGVETAEQRDQLVELGISYGQGYLFSRPLPATEYADSILGPVKSQGEPVAPAVQPAATAAAAAAVQP
jgi:diguanylate cyclase (GGDEF)-like protein